MSTILGFTNPSQFFFSVSPFKTVQSNFNVPSSPSITGFSIKEVFVNTYQDKELPVKINVRPLIEEGKGPKSFRSTITSPMNSPRSIISSRTHTFSPRSRLIESKKQEIKSPKQKHQAGEHSPRHDITDLLKHSLKTQKKMHKEMVKKSKNETKLKNEKKLKMKMLDKFIRRENLLKFKQKVNSPRPKWGIDEKKIIFETKLLREVEKHLKNAHNKNADSLENKKSPKKPKKYRKNLKNFKHLLKEHEIELKKEKNYSKKKEEIYQKVLELDDRVNKCKNLANVEAQNFEKRTKAAIKIQSLVRGFLIRRALKKYLENVEMSSNSKSIEYSSNSFSNEDEEVKNIMKVSPKFVDDPKHSSESSQKKHEKSYEKILKSQEKLKLKQQHQLFELRSKDIQEMNKLAEVLGGNQEMKEKFQYIIDRRYSKLQKLFEENAEKIIDKEEISDAKPESADSENFSMKKTPIEDFPLPSLRNTISEFSSSFLDQLKGVPNAIPIDLTFEPAEDQEKEDYIDSPEELSVYSRDTCTEPPDPNVSFPSFHSLNLCLTSQEEPNLPLISESFIDPPQSFMQSKSEEGALLSLVDEIKSEDKSVENKEESDNTLNLNEEKSKTAQNNPIFIYEESFSSNESGVIAEYSSILATPVAESNNEALSSERSKSKPLRSIIETFPHKEPSPFTASIESSTEYEGFELIINRVLLTLELNIFSALYDEILSDDAFLNSLPAFRLEKRVKIPIKGLDSMISVENQVQTDQIAVLAFVKKLQSFKTDSIILQKILNIYDPLQILAMIQENYEGVAEDLQIFDYEDIENAEVSSNISGQDFSEVGMCVQIHNKMIADVLNEAILRSTKHRITMPWSLSRQFEKINIENVLKSSVKKILKWAEIEAGKVPSVDMVNSFGELDEDKLQIVREEKLAKILTTDVSEADKSWAECDYEESQTALDISEIILAGLFYEVIQILTSL